MIVATHRPYFAPFPGFFHKARSCDVFVILDDVQFPRGTTWITRNRFKNDQGTLWITIPVHKKGLGLQKINDVRICRESRLYGKHLSSLKHAYANAPYFSEHLHFIEKLFSDGFEKLIDLNMAIIRHLMLNLGVDTRIVCLSELNIKSTGERLLVDICRYFEASAYVVQGAAYKYLDIGMFEQAGIELRCMRLRAGVYPQLWGDFLPDLSALDLLFNCGPKAREILISNCPAP